VADREAIARRRRTSARVAHSDGKVPETGGIAADAFKPSEREKEKRQPQRDGCRFSHYARNDRGDAGLSEAGWGELQ
jgi:hypothetical protein